MLKLFEYNSFRELFTVSWLSLLAVMLWKIIGIGLFEDFAPSPVEFFGTWLTLICVWLTGRQNMWCWPTGIVSVLLFAYTFYEYQLYASAILNAGYYFLVQFWGWYQWEKGRLVQWTESWTQRIGIILAILGFTLVWGWFTSYTDAQYIAVDCAIMGISIVAQWLLNYKRPEAWLLFITVNVLSTWLYFTTGLYMIGALYFGFIFVAAYGCWQWHQNRVVGLRELADQIYNELFTHETRVPRKDNNYV